MKIFITPDDIIKRGLWDRYAKYVLTKDVDVDTFIKENKEFEIHEDDALVIGIIKVVETDNLCHRFNEWIKEFLITHKMVMDKTDTLVVKKKNFIAHVDKFPKKFPKEWTPDAHWRSRLDLALEYYNRFRPKIDDLETAIFTDTTGTHELIKINQIKKILEFKNY